MVKSETEFQRISVTIHCSPRKPKWAPKWTSLVSGFGNFGNPVVCAFLRVKLPPAVFKVSLAVRHSVCNSSGSTVGKTVQFFGFLKTRRFCLRMGGCFRKWKKKTVLRTVSDSGGGLSPKETQRRKLVALERAEQKGLTSGKSLSALATWVFRKRRCRQNQRKGFLGNSFVLPLSARKKKRWAAVFQVAVVLVTLLRSTFQSAAFAATASVAAGLILSFFGVKNKLSTEFGGLLEEALSVRGEAVSPQVMWTLVGPFIRSRMSLRMLFGTATLLMILFASTACFYSSWGHSSIFHREQ